MAPPVPDVIAEGRIIAIARHLDPDRAGDLARALAAGGINVLEVTMDSPDPARAIRNAAFMVTVGAGTVMDRYQAELAIDAGAVFLVSPHLSLPLIEWGSLHGVAMIPGALSPTEIVNAFEAGAAAVKVFPISVGGEQLIREIRGPFPHIPLIPSGGISIEDGPGLLAAGAIAIGVGSWLTGPADLDEVQARATELVAACRLTS
jgi:2-dehydro-3-deoxyphosphogluconate aldolase / (4S)-4-hydroxy-2-oxoglutarate aldolase